MFALRDQKLSKFDCILLILIIYGIILRIITFWTGEILWDGSLYASMGITFTQYHNFLYPWSQQQLWSFAVTYPLYLAGFYSVFGSDIMVTKIAGILLSISLLLVVYLITRDLYNYRIGLIVTAVTALDMRLLMSLKTGFIEDMVVLFFVLTIWSMLKGIKQDDKYIILGGIFAGLTLLSKTIISPLFILIGLMGFVIWRFIYMRWDLFRNRNYLIGLAIFLIIIGIRYTINLKNPYQIMSIERIPDFSAYVQILPLKLFWILLLMGIYSIFWIPELKNSLTKIKEEYHGFLWLIITSLVLLTTISSSVFLFLEPFDWHYSIFREDNLRYVVLLYIPLMWLAIGNTNFDTKNKNSVKDGITALINDKRRILIILLALSFAGFILIEINDKMAVFLLFGGISLAMRNPKKKLAIMLIAFLIMGTNATSGSVRTEFIDAVEGLNKIIQEGDVVAIDLSGDPDVLITPFYIYPYLKNHNITFIFYSEGSNATYILSQKDVSYYGYELIETFNYKWKPTLLRGIIIGMNEKQGSQRPPMKLWKIIPPQPMPHFD